MTRAGVLHADGAARGNPGPAAIGVVLTSSSGEVLAEFGRCIGSATNNVAEYSALIAGLESALDLGVDRLVVKLDSELLVRQMTGVYRVKNPVLKRLHATATALVGRFERVEFAHVPRHENSRADALCNAALDACATPEDAASPAGAPEDGRLF